MLIATETGSTYDINPDSLVCHKRNKAGQHVDTFKAFAIKTVPEHVTSFAQLHEIPNLNIREEFPKVGDRLYVSGINIWWLSTPIVSISED